MAMGRPRKNAEFKGCDENCLNCPYPDCYKPMHLLKSTADFCSGVVEKVGESQQRMFTIELGGVGKNMPNISRKYYF